MKNIQESRLYLYFYILELFLSQNCNSNAFKSFILPNLSFIMLGGKKEI